MFTKLLKNSIDLKLTPLVMIIAGCGFIYQYFLASYSGRALGVLEEVIFTVITVMVLFMGVGAFLAKYFKNKFLAFSILESLISIVVVISVFLISGLNAVAIDLPNILAETFHADPASFLRYGWVENIQTILSQTTFVCAAAIGTLIGLEIPFLASIREELHSNTNLKNNIGVIYGVDYIGGAIGAMIWIFFLLKADVQTALGIVTATNVIVGFVFILMFKDKIKRVKLAVGIQVFTLVFLAVGCSSLSSWHYYLQDTLLVDKLVYSKNTKYQSFAITHSKNSVSNEDRYSLFINGHTQFSSSDEGIYHSLLVSPPMLAAVNPKNVLIIGGGDGLAVRNVLEFNPDSVTLLDLDPTLVDFFTNPVIVDGKQVNKPFIELTKGSFSDKRVTTMFGDAYLNAQKLAANNRIFDVIIVDLPDPSHPDLNKLYSKGFYITLNKLLANTGAISIQSGAPYSTKKSFMSIGKTLSHSGFLVDQYQHIVPSFAGQWGWTIGVKQPPYAKVRLANQKPSDVKGDWLTKGKMLSTFEFGRNYYRDLDYIEVNTINNSAIYKYYSEGWQELTASAFQ